MAEITGLEPILPESKSDVLPITPYLSINDGAQPPSARVLSLGVPLVSFIYRKYRVGGLLQISNAVCYVRIANPSSLVYVTILCILLTVPR